jgi:hypothetical protein
LCTYLSDNELVFGLKYAIGQTNIDDRRSRCIDFTSVDETYLCVTAAEREQLTGFFVVAEGVTFLESAVSVEDAGGKLAPSFQPVGIERVPSI